jgi:hypothetical protein
MQEARSWTGWLFAVAIVATPVAGGMALIGGALALLDGNGEAAGWLLGASGLSFGLMLNALTRD